MDRSSERAKKLQKLRDLRQNTPHASKTAVAGLLNNVSKTGVPELTSANNIREANRQLLEECDSYGPLFHDISFKCKDGSTLQLHVLNLLTFLFQAFRAGGAFYDLIKTFADAEEAAGLILYSDEICPCNPLASVASRKLWIVYAGIRQMGGALSNENSWVTLFVCRSSLVSQIEGHMSQVMRVILEGIFDHSSAEVQALGILLKSPARDALRPYYRLRLKFQCFVQDGAAMKFSYAMKGDAGTRFCVLCANVYTCKDNEDDLSEICKFLHVSDLRLTTNEELLDSWKRLIAKAHEETHEQFKLREQATGWCFSSEALWSSAKLEGVLKPVDNWVHDWMHALVSNGIYDKAVYLLLEKLRLWEMVNDYLQSWTVPKHLKGFKIESILNKNRVDKHRKATRLSATASEVLTLQPFLTHFVRKVLLPSDSDLDACLTMLALGHLLDLLQAANFSQTVNGLMIQDAVHDVLRHWVRAGWEKSMVKKHHWLLHLGQEYDRHSLSLNCFALERKHKNAKHFGSNVYNTPKFEKSLREEIAVKEMTMACSNDWYVRSHKLENSSKPPKAWLPLAVQLFPWNEDIVSGSTLLIPNSASVTSGDFILFKDQSAGQVEHFLHVAKKSNAFSKILLWLRNVTPMQSGDLLSRSHCRTEMWKPLPRRWRLQRMKETWVLSFLGFGGKKRRSYCHIHVCKTLLFQPALTQTFPLYSHFKLICMQLYTANGLKQKHSSLHRLKPAHT